jgi:uncharacterized membrane protein
MKKWFAILALLVLLVPLASAQQTPITKTATVAVTVAAATDFTLSPSTSAISTYPNRTIAFVATVTAVNTFAGQVVMTLSGMPTGWTVTQTPANGTVTLDNTAPKGVSYSIVIPANATIGVSTITVTATSTNYN